MEPERELCLQQCLKGFTGCGSTLVLLNSCRHGPLPVHKPLTMGRRGKDLIFSSIGRNSMPVQVHLCRPALNICFGPNISHKKWKFPPWSVCVQSICGGWGFSERRIYLEPFSARRLENLLTLCVSLSPQPVSSN